VDSLQIPSSYLEISFNPSAYPLFCILYSLLRDNENYDTRDFTLYVASKKWVNSELVPLMELSTEDR
jgi:hypothetical protein